MLEITILVLSVFITGLVVWVLTSNHYKNQVENLKLENLQLKNQASLNENIVNDIKVSFTKIAQDALKNQQEALISEHAKDLSSRIDLFKAEEITPINKLLKDFKDTIDNYQKAHQNETLEIKDAISTAEKYAKALTMNQNSKGEFGENWLEQIFKFANLEENIHYTKQFTTGHTKPDFLINLPNNKNIIVDSKVILKNYIEYRQDENNSSKKAFIDDLTKCITLLSQKNYEEIEGLAQPDFILMYIPIETCISLIYTDYDLKKVVELANSRNIIIVGTASLLVTLRLVNQLWASQTQYDNVQNIIEVGENLYNNMASHAQNLLNIQDLAEKVSNSIKTEINRFTTRNKGSIFKEAEKLREFGIESKSSKSGKKILENRIPQEFLQEHESEQS
jgi:DNA recombination protein RmuC